MSAIGLNGGSKAIVAAIEKLEAVLVGHRVQLEVWDSEPNAFPEHIIWDPKKKSFTTPHEFLTFKVAYPGNSSYNMYELSARLQRLTAKCMKMQADYDAAALAAAGEVALYLTKAPWFKPEMVDPVGAVLPRENT